MGIKDGLKSVLAIYPPLESGIRKRYHLPPLYRAKFLARFRSKQKYQLDDFKATVENESLEIQRLGREIGTYMDEYMDGSLYNPLLHPAFTKFPSERESSDRYQLVSTNVEAAEGSVLDIGCHIGAYFASRFDDDGYDAIALDENVVHAHFSKRLVALRNPDVEVVWDSLFNWDGRFGPFDVVCGFNVFHHMLKERRLYDRLVRWLDRVRMRELFIQIPDQQEPMWENVCKWLTGEEWVELILDTSNFTSVSLLGKPSNNRPIYHFTTK